MAPFGVAALLVGHAEQAAEAQVELSCEGLGVDLFRATGAQIAALEGVVQWQTHDVEHRGHDVDMGDLSLIHI